MKPPQAARAALVLDALLAALIALNDKTFSVLDGPYPGEINQGDAIALGVGSESINVTRDRQPGLGRASVETVRVICSAWSWAGDTDMASRRARCAELLTIVADVVDANSRLGGVVDQTDLEGEQSWVQSQNSGAACSVGFIITCITAL